MIHPVSGDDGTTYYVLSARHGGGRPGVYETVTAAHLAQRLDDTVLQALQGEANAGDGRRVITEAMLRQVPKETTP